ncbi:WD40 repeat-like protein [Auriscalpium vulgare]|uniref:WD40 repeat-like protein n=1 Tax=Auriscalpium vulgare TaxID=40419 RepID=A0ACB8RQD9_9AGAM|nr:WD40 repeat-like protein [Auriscalpium vulgare]
MDTGRLDLATSQYAIAAIILDDMIPSWKRDLNATQRICVAQHRGEIDVHLEAILSTLNGEKNERLPRSSEYPNLGIMKRLPDGCGAVSWGDDDGFGAGLGLPQEGEVLSRSRIESDELEAGRGSGEANPVVYGSSSASDVPPEEEIADHNVATMGTDEIDHPYRSEQQRERAHQGEEIGAGRAKIWPASPTSSSHPATVYNSGSHLNGLERPHSAMSMDSEISVASVATVTSRSVSIAKSANSHNSYNMKMNMYHIPLPFERRKEFKFRQFGMCRGHKDKVVSVALSPDGKRIVSGSYDQTVRIWDTETGQQVGTPLKGHRFEVVSVAFSPDGRHVVSGSYDNTIRIWDAETGKLKGAPLKGHKLMVVSVAFSPDGRRVVSGWADHTIRIWDAQTGQVVGLPLEGHTHTVMSVNFSPDGTRVISGSADRTICIWDAETGQLVGTPWKGHTRGVFSVAFSPDGRRVVSCSDDRTIRIWDAETGQQVGTPMEGHTEQVWSVAFSPDGSRVVSGSSDKTIRIWDAETGQQVGTLEGHTDSVRSVAFSPNGRRVVSASYDKTIRIWREEFDEYRGHLDVAWYGP